MQDDMIARIEELKVENNWDHHYFEALVQEFLMDSEMLPPFISWLENVAKEDSCV